MSIKRREKLLKIWYGCDLPNWLRLLKRGRLHLSLHHCGVLAVGTVVSMINSCLKAIQESLYGHLVDQTLIGKDPLFILGHWRSGTTLLHELLMCDEAHTCPNTYQCMSPHHFLVSERLVPRLLSPLLARQRPMDNMELHWSSPQEDEFALCNMGLPSPYLLFAFPQQALHYLRTTSLEYLSSDEMDQWKQGLTRFLRQITFKTGKRVVLKSPPHTFRLRILAETFPKAQFVHIVRNPFKVYPSMLHLLDSLARLYALQRFTVDDLREFAFETFIRMHAKLKSDKAYVTPERFTQIRYEDLVANPVGELEKIYSTLGLEGFARVRPKVETYFRRKKTYKTNRFEISEELHSRIALRWRDIINDYGYASDIIPSDNSQSRVCSVSSFCSSKATCQHLNKR